MGEPTARPGLSRATLASSYDPVTGAVDYTLGQLAAQAPGTSHETFHFVLNNTVVKDNRIPPYGFSYDEARKRNALPVPATQYGSPRPAARYNYWDEVTLNPPRGATFRDDRPALPADELGVRPVPATWRTTRQNAFLANEGVNLLNAWLNTGMAAPYTMATATVDRQRAVRRAGRGEQPEDRESQLDDRAA